MISLTWSRLSNISFSLSIFYCLYVIVKTSIYNNATNKCPYTPIITFVGYMNLEFYLRLNKICPMSWKNVDAHIGTKVDWELLMLQKCICLFRGTYFTLLLTFRVGWTTRLVFESHLANSHLLILRDSETKDKIMFKCHNLNRISWISFFNKM